MGSGKTLFNALLLPILAGSCLASVAAGRETFDSATFTAPPGWERVSRPGVASFRAPQGTTQIFVYPGQAAPGDPQANFNAEWTRLVTVPLGVAPPPQVNVDRTPNGWTAVSGAADVNRQGGSFAVLLMTATGQGRMASVVVSLAGQAHLAEVEQFFRQLEFRVPAASTPPSANAAVPPKAANAAPAPRSEGAKAALVPIAPARIDKSRPEGLFYRLKVQVQSGARLETQPWIFLPGNRAARVFPYGGGDSFDAPARCLPDTCGSYRIEGGTLSVRWDNGRTDRWAFAATGEGITLDGTLFRPARPMTEAALAGEWTGSGDSGNALANVYRFERGGNFTFGSGRQGVSGRYRLQGLTLVLAFADGTESRRTLFAAGGGEPAGLISVEGEAYKRK
ncbi:MAG TPA: hypothetical protein VFV71_03260 [Burkholderiales bacterium]|nr:hypothetical protein [Burkholderiales bacterium]